MPKKGSYPGYPARDIPIVYTFLFLKHGGMKYPVSAYELLKGKLTFTTEPLWFRIIIYIITAAFLLAVIRVLQQWAIPVLMMGGLRGVNWLEFFKPGKGRVDQ